ncbi:MAG TPA: hypothetical protein VK081_08020 [Planctomycetota bacterium]|nr:hypothetical protein [Planctomycetota bacterium]
MNSYRRCRRALLLVVPLAACSVFPDARRPPSVIESMDVEYAFAPGAPRAIEVPASNAEITVLELAVEPAPHGERFERGHRYLLLPLDCKEAKVRCRVQRWAGEQPADLTAPYAELFPGARRISVIDEPR